MHQARLYGLLAPGWVFIPDTRIPYFGRQFKVIVSGGCCSDDYISVALDCVASCGLVTKSTPLLLAIAAICSVFGIAQDNSDLRYGLLVVAAALVAIYFFKRSAAIAISSNGGDKITLPVKGMGRDNILEFLEAVEEARFKFIGRIGQ